MPLQQRRWVRACAGMMAPARDGAGERALRIAYIPHEDIGNAYTIRMRELISRFGAVERFSGIKGLLRRLPMSWRYYDALIVNWLDNEIVAFDSGRISFRATARLFLRTLLMKPFAKRMVFVRHNRYPHRTAPGSESLARRLIDAYEALFDVVVTHSGAEGQRRRRYCPHPLYRAAPDAPSVTDRPSLPDGYFLVFGRIDPYKKIDALAAAFPAGRTLVVAGAVGDRVYAERLGAMRRDNFVFRPGRLEETEAQRLVRCARGLVIANGEPDVVVSGSFFYALSFGCPVYAVATPFLAWVQRRIGADLLVLAPDIAGLCAAIDAADRRPPAAASRDAIECEFGDGAVQRALASALGISP